MIFLDDYHTRLGNSLAFRQKLSQFVSSARAERSGGPHHAINASVDVDVFPRNHEATASQIMNFIGRRYDYRPRNALEERYEQETPQQIERLRNAWVIEGLRGVCEYMGSFRAGRKTLLYVSEGLTNNMPPGVLTTGTDFPTMPMAGPDSTDARAESAYLRLGRTHLRFATGVQRGHADEHVDLSDSLTRDRRPRNSVWPTWCRPRWTNRF